MAKNSAEGNKARTARYRAAMAARGIRPVQVIALEGAHALLRQATALMTREQDPLELRQAMRQASGANDPGQGHGGQGEERQVLAAAVAAAEVVRAELAEAQDAERRAEQRALAQAEAAQAAAKDAAAALARAEIAERVREEIVGELRKVKAEAVQARTEVERFQKASGLRGRLIRWIVR